MLRIAFFVLLIVPISATWASNPYSIFILHSYSQEYPWTKNQHNSFVENFLAQSSESTLISTEYLDTKRRKFDTRYKENFYQYLKNKYNDYTPDIIYVTDDDSLTFAQSHLSRLFKAPVIFSGVNNLGLQLQLSPSRYTGVYEKKDVVKNIEVLKELDPDLNEIVIVGDASSTYVAIEDEIKQQLKNYPGISTKYIAKQNINELTNALKQHKGKYLFLTTLGKITDPVGNVQTLKNIISQIANAGNFIIISMEDNYLEKGVLGGYVTSGKLQGKTAAQLAIEYQKTRNIENILSVSNGSNEYIFDYRELNKNKFKLPAHIAKKSIILNKPLSFYQRNKKIILGIIIALTILLIASLITFLVILARKNKQIQASSYKEKELEVLINDATKELLAERQKLNQAQAITHIGNYSWDVKSDITTWSDELYRIVGYAVSEITPSYEAYVHCVHPEDRSKFTDLTRNVMKLKESYEGEYRVLRPDGDIRYVYEQGEVKLDANNEVIGLYGVIQDVTQRKKDLDEHDRLQRELNQSRKMEALGKLTGGIAHDFNNMLSIISGYSNLALDGYKNALQPNIVNYFENIRQASNRARDLIKKMLVFSRNDQGKSEALNVEEVTSESVQMLRSVIPSSVEIVYEHDDDLPKVMMDSVQMQQIIMNLSFNAKDAMNDSGVMKIGLRLRNNINHECAACHKKILGTWVELTVSDTGMGIDKSTLDHIFEPFYTTKDVSKGTGMGLSIVHSIVDQHGGHILIDTELNQGTAFHILLPCMKVPDTDHHELPMFNKKTKRGNGEKILVVDDEPILGDLLNEYLTDFNYRCVVNSSSTEAWKMFESDPDSFSMIVTDQTMPKMTGTELIEKIRGIKPGMPAILVTGHSDTINRIQAEAKNIIYMNKPVDVSALLNTIADSLKKVV